MKKINLIAVIVLCLALSLAMLTGCGKTEQKEETKAPETSAQEETEAVETTHPEPAENNDFSATQGSWKLAPDWEGSISVARMEMDGKGHFETYLEDGSVELTGDLRIAEENGSVRYDMYDSEGTYVDGFYLQENNQLTMVEGAAAVYVKNDFSATQGSWKLAPDWEGSISVASIEMDGKGHFETYLEDGSVKLTGNLRIAEENGSVRYDMYDSEGTYVDGFYLQENDQLTMVEGAAAVYVK